ncbi:MAG: hypothetical protein ACT4NY_19485 [Pseudonocardiales bacterium]
MLDSGGLIGFERGDRAVAALIEATRRRGEPVVTSSGCIAQVWRGGPGQALLARLLRGVREYGLDGEASRPIGTLCGAAGSCDVVDAHVALLAHDSDVLLTSDTADLRRLLSASGSTADVRGC